MGISVSVLFYLFVEDHFTYLGRVKPGNTDTHSVKYVKYLKDSWRTKLN